MGPSGLVALLAGWFVTEVGRQPWGVYGVLRTVEAASAHNLQTMTLSLVSFVMGYLAIFGLGIFYLIQLLRKGSQLIDEPPASAQRPARL
ncbi:Bacterial Cytochrome Ubiquinol Oxidase [Marinomonas fungiae]|uniref:Bacterial Cytochrome Ubiquinol Oxidase n=1 Tax=Marinomonas fungiae TaxID=1137284 RepID=A0A0K6IUE0_9GAMM|nr:Bacterial Cytochrome Ubiquinol Oxidase [Marinomonas fungiae]